MALHKSKANTSPGHLLNQLLRGRCEWLSTGQWSEPDRSALDGARGEAGDVVVEEPDVDDHDRHAREDGAHHQRAPVIDVAADLIRGDIYYWGSLMAGA